MGQTQTGTAIPIYSALSPDGQLIVFNNLLTIRDPGNTNPKSASNLNLVRTDTVPVGTIEMGNGDAFDFMRSEFIGFSWTPDGNSFATSAYLPVSLPGGTLNGIGIVRYSRNSPGGPFARSAALSIPTIQTNRSRSIGHHPNLSRLLAFWYRPRVFRHLRARFLASQEPGKRPTNHRQRRRFWNADRRRFIPGRTVSIRPHLV